jgi:hypothetical protein
LKHFYYDIFGEWSKKNERKKISLARGRRRVIMKMNEARKTSIREAKFIVFAEREKKRISSDPIAEDDDDSMQLLIKIISYSRQTAIHNNAVAEEKENKRTLLLASILTLVRLS